MAKIQSYKDIIAWQKAHELVLCTYKITQTLPTTEKFNLISQMRRAVVSVSSNIVEGFARRTVNDSLYFYNISRASLNELEYQFMICKDLGYISEDVYNEAYQFCRLVGSLVYRWAESQKNNSINSK
jgi:four helix bundle protein